MAPIYALEDLEDAFELTRAFLTPFDRSTWLRLALVAFFLGGAGAGANPFQWVANSGNVASPGGTAGPELTTELLALVAVIVLALVAIAVAFAFLGAIMEFVFVEALREREIHVREYVRAHWRRGLRLFGFRIVLGVLVLGVFLVLATPLLLAAVDPGPIGPGILLLSLAVLFIVGLAVAFVVGLVNGFTTVFVVPIMLVEDCGVLAAWQRLWRSLRRDPIQYVTYAIAGVFLGLGASTFVAFAAGLLVLLALIPLSVLVGVAFAAFAVSVDVLGFAVLAVAGVLFVLAIVVSFAVAQVPTLTFLRYYALLVLGDVAPDLDPVPDQRASIREPAVDEDPASA